MSFLPNVELCSAHFLALIGWDSSERPNQRFSQPATLLGVLSWVRFCQQEFGEFPRLVGRSCSYLLLKQAGGTPQILVDKTSPMTGRLFKEAIWSQNTLLTSSSKFRHITSFLYQVGRPLVPKVL